MTGFLVERKAFRPCLVGGEIGRMEKKRKEKKKVKIGERGIWLGGGMERNFGEAKMFSPLAHQNPISPIWRENLRGFISTKLITFLPLFL